MPAATPVPQPTITSTSKYASTNEQRFPLLIDFGKRVMELNPLNLFSVSGLGRWDAPAGGSGPGSAHPPGGQAQPAAHHSSVVVDLRPGLAVGLAWASLAQPAWCRRVCPLPPPPALARLDTLYDVVQGQIYLVGAVLTPDQPTLVTGLGAALGGACVCVMRRRRGLGGTRACGGCCVTAGRPRLAATGRRVSARADAGLPMRLLASTLPPHLDPGPSATSGMQ